MPGLTLFITDNLKAVKLLAVCFLATASAHAQLPAGSIPDTLSFISNQKNERYFTLSSSGISAPLHISSEEWPGVIRAYKDLQTDIARVTGNTPGFYIDKVPRAKDIVVAGTIGKSPVIDKLIRQGKLKAGDITGRWESFIIQTVDRPFQGVKRALVIAGSDKRGTIYGIYQISREIGVSPWYWWADVPVKKSNELYVLPGRRKFGEPSVKYRGIFLNDEYPALTKWVDFKYGSVTPSDKPPVPAGVADYGRDFYSRIFEVILRLKGNYLWPAMWNNAFNEDDSVNAKLADEYGIVMGTSHQEPMLRAQKEWDRRYKKTLGSWSWTSHADTLIKFWREGIRRNKNYESIITVGLRGADDTEMGPGGPEANIAKLERITEIQRKLIAEELNPEVKKVPQMWCLYKEVQDYYNAGLRVPDDVTLLWAEDNWGNVRRLPTPEERLRSGGAGLYYHFDYHGGPRSYQWLNTNPLPKIWDQMSLAKQYGADRIWIVNTGHFRGYELPIEYFLSLAWDTKVNSSSGITEFIRKWAAREFGNEYASDIADIISKYTKFNGRRKPELLSPFTYSLTNYHEAETIVEEYNKLEARAEEIQKLLPDDMHDAFYHLVLFPVKACALVNEIYVTAGRNALYSAQGRALTNALADRTEILFNADTALMGYYNRVYAGGRWNHFMDQAHLGYIDWADPPVNSLRAIKLDRIELPDSALMGVAVEGSDIAWPSNREVLRLPEFDVFNRQNRYMEIFNRGTIPFKYRITADNPWIIIDRNSGTITDEQRISVGIDWAALAYGKHEGTITVKNAEQEVRIALTAFKPPEPQSASPECFVEADGYVSMEAEHFMANKGTEVRRWERIEDYGRTLSGLRATTITDAPPAVPGKDSPELDYRIYLFSTGEFETVLHAGPSLNFIPDRDFKIGISIDNEAPQVVNVVPREFNAQNGNALWEKTVMDNTRYIKVKLVVGNPGYHTLKIWMIDPGIVLEKIVINTGNVRPSYLGPPESFRLNRNGQIRLPKLISDGMVIQRGVNARIWGWSAPDESITISFIGSTYFTKADQSGNWSLNLAPAAAGGPYSMTIKGTDSVTISNILVGDVWLCSGQSNMELPVKRVRPLYEEEIPLAENNNIRYFSIPKQYDFKLARKDVQYGAWVSATPGSVLDFSAAAWFFAKKLYETYKVPVGLINASMGGTPAEAWMSEEALKKFPEHYNELLRFRSDSLVNAIEKSDGTRIREWYKLLSQNDEGYKDPKKKWYSPDIDVSDWKTISVPGFWSDTGLKGINGVVWFRKEIDLPPEAAGLQARLNLGRIVDADSAFLNGIFVGTTSYQYPPRRYTVPAGVLKEGKNILTVRVISNEGDAGFVPGKPYDLTVGDFKTDLSGEWIYKTGTVMPPLKGQTFINYKPGGLFNAMISPLLNYRLKGIIWYQGESNADKPAEYRSLFPSLIIDWRKNFDQGDIPFLYVQLPNFKEPKNVPSESNWALFREAQMSALQLPNTGMAVAIDIGEWNDIHPLNKKDVGIRLALAAMKIAYGDSTIVFSGPVYQSMQIKGRRVILTFTNTGSGLYIKGGGSLRYFAIGDSLHFVWGKAHIQGNKRVIVQSKDIRNPVAVRYAWADNPEGANLYNREGLPAAPFRTDKK